MHDLAKEARAVLEAATVLAGTIEGAQQLVTEVPVAMFEIDELKPGAPGALARPHEVLHQPIQLRVRHARIPIVEAEAPIQHGMVIDDARLGSA